jgi:two-component system response regulator DevR
MEKVRVAIVDDHPIIREGIEELASNWDDVEVVATGESADEALTIASTTGPDVMLLDYRLGKVPSTTVCRNVVQQHPEIKVIAFTAYADPGIAVEMVRAGAVGFLLKDSEAALIHRAIKSAAKGDAPIDPRVTARIVTVANEAPGAADHTASLDIKDELLLGMVAAGLSNREIADRLFVSEKTVKNRLTMLYKKLGVTGRTQAAAIGVQYGFHRLIDETPR